MIAEAVGAVELAIWAYLLAGRGAFWRLPQSPAPALKRGDRSIAAVIPARDEAESVHAAVTSLRAQDYPGPIAIHVVDDHSSDGTASQAASAGARVIEAGPLPPGWTGKLWAIHCGLQVARGPDPDYVLLTDADIVHGPHSVRDLVARAEAGNLDLVSHMVKLRCESAAERALVPAFLFFFLKLYPPAWIADPNARTAGAAGGCILIRPRALDRIGGIEAIRAELIDDCALARHVKRGGPTWMGVTADSISIRDYSTFGEIGRMISRTAFTQLRHSAWVLAGAIAGLMITYMAAPLLAAAGPTPLAHALGVASWGLMAVAFQPCLRLYGRSPLWGFALPLIALFYAGATVWSAMAYWTGRGGAWKGRLQDTL